MLYYLKGLFIVISLFICSHTFASDDKSDFISDKLNAPVSEFGQKVLYKVNIEVYKNRFSGLLFIKRDADSIHYHVVMLSEVGLTICAFLSDGKKMELKEASSLFQSKAAQNLLAEDFGLLIHSETIKRKKDDKIKSVSGTIFNINEDGTIGTIRKRRVINGIRANLQNYDKGVPSDINFDHSGIKFSMKLNLLKVN